MWRFVVIVFTDSAHFSLEVVNELSAIPYWHMSCKRLNVPLDSDIVHQLMNHFQIFIMSSPSFSEDDVER